MISPRSTPPTTTVPAFRVHSARPFFPTSTLPFVRMTPVKSPSMRRQAVEVELTLELRAFPDDGIDEGVVGDVRIAQSLLLRFTAMVEAFSGVMERNCIGLT